MSIHKEDYFLGNYIDWRNTRINKIESIFGKEFFKDKTILEVACGYGHLGKHFVENLGSIVTFTEGRESYIEYIRKNNPDSEIHCIDQDQKWNLNKKFDVVIHFGVLYHLDNWQQDLECACSHTDLLILESEVFDDSKNKTEFKFNDHGGYDQALNVKATRPSALFVQSELEKNGFEFVRYDDSDLNSGRHLYDWQEQDIGDPGYGKRRFWVARRK